MKNFKNLVELFQNNRSFLLARGLFKCPGRLFHFLSNIFGGGEREKKNFILSSSYHIRYVRYSSLNRRRMAHIRYFNNVKKILYTVINYDQLRVSRSHDEILVLLNAL